LCFIIQGCYLTKLIITFSQYLLYIALDIYLKNQFDLSLTDKIKKLQFKKTAVERS